MKRFIYTIAISLIAYTGAFAQGMFSISYDINVPVGSTSDFISNTSFRGFGIEGRSFVSDNISIGGSFNWTVFYQEDGPQEWSNIEGEDDTRTVFGKQFRYINSFPLMANAHYYFGEWDAIRPYLGVGIGTTRINQRLDFGLYQVNREKWRFGMAPEVGVLIPVNYNFSFNLSAKYQYAFKAGDNEEVSYLNFKIGFAFM